MGKRMLSLRQSVTQPRAREIFLRRSVSPRKSNFRCSFVVEDNAYGISSPTRKINPLALTSSA